MAWGQLPQAELPLAFHIQSPFRAPRGLSHLFFLPGIPLVTALHTLRPACTPHSPFKSCATFTAHPEAPLLQKPSLEFLGLLGSDHDLLLLFLLFLSGVILPTHITENLSSVLRPAPPNTTFLGIPQASCPPGVLVRCHPLAQTLQTQRFEMV